MTIELLTRWNGAVNYFWLITFLTCLTKIKNRKWSNLCVLGVPMATSPMEEVVTLAPFTAAQHAFFPRRQSDFHCFVKFENKIESISRVLNKANWFVALDNLAHIQGYLVDWKIFNWKQLLSDLTKLLLSCLGAPIFRSPVCLWSQRAVDNGWIMCWLLWLGVLD